MELKQVDVIGELEAHSNANTSNSRLTCISNKDKWGGPQASLVSQAATKTGHIGGHQCHCLVSLRPLMGTTHGGLAAQGDIFRKNQDRRGEKTGCRIVSRRSGETPLRIFPQLCVWQGDSE